MYIVCTCMIHTCSGGSVGASGARLSIWIGPDKDGLHLTSLRGAGAQNTTTTPSRRLLTSGWRIARLAMALPLPPGLVSSEVAFLCEMELVTVVPRQRLESIDLLSVRKTRASGPSPPSKQIHLLFPPPIAQILGVLLANSH